MPKNLLQPLPDKAFTSRQAQHLMRRAGFGCTLAQARQLAHLGPEASVERLLAGDLPGVAQLPGVDPSTDKLDDPSMQAPTMEDLEQLHHMRRWWLKQVASSDAPLLEQMTLLWHGHFASSYTKVLSSPLMLQQHALLRQEALGSFAYLVRDVVHDPAMLRYLDSDKNLKAHPNENLARELMELFTLGEGNYSEDDIKEGARALTGFGIDGHDFYFNKGVHDAGTKTILGRTGKFDGDDFVNIILEQEACPKFIALKLYGHLVSDIDRGVSQEQQQVVDQLAQVLRQHDYQLRPVLKTLLMSQAFYDASVMGNKIKSPVQLAGQMARELGVPLVDKTAQNDVLNLVALMGQELFAPPSVAGWAGGRTWLNASTLFVRQNTCAYLLTGLLLGERRWLPKQIGLDVMQVVQEVETQKPERVVDHLTATLLARPCPEQARRQLLGYLADYDNELNEQSVTGLLLLITALPAYQLH